MANADFNFHVQNDHDVLPTTFVNNFCKVADVHYLTCQSTSLHISYARTNQRKNTIRITWTKLWNKQPLFVRDSPSLSFFKVANSNRALEIWVRSHLRYSKWHYSVDIRDILYEVKSQGHTTPKLDLESWRMHHS